MTALMPRTLGILGCLTAFFVSAAGCDKFETRESHYSDYDEFKQSRNPGRWVPPFVPKTATDIREFHYVDSDSVWAKFNSNSKTIVWLTKLGCRSGESAPDLPSAKRVSAAWWDKRLLKESSDSTTASIFEFYECPGDLGGHVAVSTSTEQMVFFWR